MPLFRYEAFDAVGKSKIGVLSAPDIDDAKYRLRDSNLIIRAISQMNVNLDLVINDESLVHFFEMINLLVDSGVSLYDSLVAVQEEYVGSKEFRLISMIADQVRGGDDLSVAMSCFPGSFSKTHCAIIAAGEASGSISKSLSRLAAMVGAQVQLKKQVVSALIYPGILVVFALSVIMIMMLFVVPMIAPLLENSEVGLLTYFVIGASNLFVFLFWPYFPVATILLILLVIRFKPYLVNFVRRLVWKMPILGTIAIENSLAQFSCVMGELLVAGIDLVSSMDLASNVVSSDKMKDFIRGIREKVVEGGSLGSELAEPFFPKTAQRMIRVGENSGELGAVFLKVGRVYQEEVDRKLIRLTSLLQPMIIVFMGAIVGLIMVGVLLPMTDVGSLNNGI